jgi:hypothetical protein
MVSQDPGTRTRRFSWVMHFVVKASARMMAKVRPLGTATTRVTDMMRLLMNAIHTLL